MIVGVPIVSSAHSKDSIDMSNHRIENRTDLEYEITELIQEYASWALSMINIGDVLNRLSRLLVVHRLWVIPGFYLLVKAMVTMEGIDTSLIPIST